MSFSSFCGTRAADGLDGGKQSQGAARSVTRRIHSHQSAASPAKRLLGFASGSAVRAAPSCEVTSRCHSGTRTTVMPSDQASTGAVCGGGRPEGAVSDSCKLIAQLTTGSSAASASHGSTPLRDITNTAHSSKLIPQLTAGVSAASAGHGSTPLRDITKTARPLRSSAARHVTVRRRRRCRPPTSSPEINSACALKDDAADTASAAVSATQLLTLKDERGSGKLSSRTFHQVPSLPETEYTVNPCYNITCHKNLRDPRIVRQGTVPLFYNPNRLGY